MRLTWKHGDRSLSFERCPMPPERFDAVCRLAEGVIAGAVLLGAIHMVGVWAIAWAVGALVLVGLYRLAREWLK